MADTFTVPPRRCKPGQFFLTGGHAVNYGKTWQANTPFPIKECLHEKFLLDVRGGVQAGDWLDIVRFTSDAFGEVIETCTKIPIRKVDALGVVLGVKLERIDYWGDTPQPGVAVDRGLKGKFVVRLDGAVVREFNTVVEAEEFAKSFGAETKRPVTMFNPTPAKAAA